MAKTVKSVGRIEVKNPSQKDSMKMAEKSVKSHRRTFFAKALKVSSVAPIVGIPMFSIASSPVVLKMQGAWGAKDIMNEFALALSQFDRVILLPIYPARELPIEGIKSSVLQKKIKSKNIVELIKRENLLSYINNIPEKIKVFLGAGDIGLEIKKIKEN